MKPIAPVIFALGLFFSCDYEPDGENFVVLTKPDASGMSVELTDTSDTLFVYGNAEIRYHSITENKPVLWFRSYLDGEQFGSHNEAAASVFLYTLNRNNGCYTLKIELVTGPGTGSLAEVRGREELKVERTYVLCIDNSQPDPIEITSIRHIDGTLELVWEKYKKQNFQKYRLFKYYYRPFGQYFETHWLTEIADRETTHIYDSTFIGGKVKYYLSVVAADKESDTRDKEFEDPYDLNPSWKWDENTNGTFKWRRPKYYKNFSSYSVSFDNMVGDPRTFTVTGINDTTLTFDTNLVFARRARAIINAYPKRYDYYHNEFVSGSVDNIDLGKPFPWYTYWDPHEDRTCYNPALDKYFALQLSSHTELIRIDAATHDVEQAAEVPLRGSFLLSDNGQYLYVLGGDEYRRLDPLTFSVIQSYDVSTLCGPSGGFNWISGLSENNRLALTNASGSYVLDMTTFALLQQWPFDGKSIQISTTGTYLIRGNEILKWNATQYVSYANAGDTRSRIFIENDTKVLLDKIDRVEVLNLATKTIERTISLEGSYYLRYDAVSGLLGGYVDPYSSAINRFYLYDLNSNEKVADFPVAGHMILQNNSLLASGSILPLSFFYP